MLDIFTTSGEILQLLWAHLQMVGLAVFIATLIALPLSWLINDYRGLNLPILGILGTIYTIPSLALMILFVPIFGLNQLSVVVAMILYTQVILVRSFSVALQSIDSAIMDAARGMGMTRWQQWWWVQVPLILPVGLAGVRLATIVSIAIATIGAKFGAGGLGVLLFDGISQSRYDKIFLGAIVVSSLAFFMNGILLVLESICGSGWHKR